MQHTAQLSIRAGLRGGAGVSAASGTPEIKARRVLNVGTVAVVELRRAESGRIGDRLRSGLIAGWREIAGSLPDRGWAGSEPTAELVEAVRDGYRGLVNTAVAPAAAAALGRASQYMRRSIEGRKDITIPSAADAGAEIPAAMIADGWAWRGGVDGLLAWLETHAGELITSITDGQLAAIRRVLYRMTVTEPGSPAMIARAIREVIGLRADQVRVLESVRAALIEDGVSGAQMEAQLERMRLRLLRQRARTIARTEIAESWNRGMIESVRQARREGLVEADVLKRWWTANDERTCQLCGPLHGETVGIDEPFSWGGSHPVRHPNCVLPWNVVSVAGLSAATRAFYDGPCVEVSLRSGGRLAVTENHPVLTPSGFVAAGLLTEGSNVISTLNPERVVEAINPHDHEGPSRIDDVFAALAMTRGVASRGVEVAAEDFHGDAVFFDGDVNVVWSDRHLGRARDAVLGEHLRKPGLGLGDHVARLGARLGALAKLCERCLATADRLMRGSHQSLPLGLACAGHPLGHCVAASAWFDPGLKQASAHDTSGNPESFGNGLFRFSGDVAVDVGAADLHPPTGPSATHSVGLRPDGAGLLEDFVDRDGVDPDVARDFLHRFAGLVAVDDVVGVKRFNYRGHVYDLQSSSMPLYIANTVVVHNCRCAVQYVEASLPGARRRAA